MSHCTFSIQESGGRQEKRAGADGGNASGSCRCGLDPCEVRLVVDSALCAGAAGNDQCVDLSGDVLNRDRTAESNPAVGSKGMRSVWRRYLDAVTGSVRKDLESPRHIEYLHRR